MPICFSMCNRMNVCDHLHAQPQEIAYMRASCIQRHALALSSVLDVCLRLRAVGRTTHPGGLLLGLWAPSSEPSAGRRGRKLPPTPLAMSRTTWGGGAGLRRSTRTN